MIDLQHGDYQEQRALVKERYNRVFAFSSKRKRSSIVITRENSEAKRVHVKGASEIVVQRCTHYLDSSGTPQTMSEEMRNEVTKDIENMANKALRTIGLAFRDLPGNIDVESLDTAGEPLVESGDLVLIGIVGIKDPVR